MSIYNLDRELTHFLGFAVLLGVIKLNCSDKFTRHHAEFMVVSKANIICFIFIC